MEMQTVQERNQLVCHISIPRCASSPQAASLGTGVVYVVTALSRAFGINPQAYAFAVFFGFFAVFFELSRRVEYDMICVGQNFFELVIAICCAKTVNLFIRHMLGA